MHSFSAKHTSHSPLRGMLGGSQVCRAGGSAQPAGLQAACRWPPMGLLQYRRADATYRLCCPPAAAACCHALSRTNPRQGASRSSTAGRKKTDAESCAQLRSVAWRRNETPYAQIRASGCAKPPGASGASHGRSVTSFIETTRVLDCSKFPV